MHLINEHIVTVLRGCIKMTSVIQHNEYLNEEMVKGQVMKCVMTATQYQTMDELQIECKLKTHGYVLEAV